ncbi:FHA domain-containing protein [Thermoleophilia bacterium SCSIO 60948]|nr:FHA domain-containing protein [Thermoleophilia bacterium SCSIO 60948]
MSELALYIKEGPHAGEEHLIDGDLVLGREASSVDVLIDDKGVSRRHASVMVEGATAVLRDLDSSNGTYVNGEMVDAPRRLRSGDVIQVGQTEIELRSGADTTRVIAPAAAASPTEIVTPPSNRPAPPPPAPPPAPIYTGGQDSRRPAEPVADDRGQIDDEENWPAVAAICVGALALGLLIVSFGALFPFSLAMGIGAIIAGRFGKRMVTSGRSTRFYGLARWGGRLGWWSVVLSIIALILLVVVARLLDIAGDNLGDLIDQAEQAIQDL